jgi:hypothetical protein
MNCRLQRSLKGEDRAFYKAHKTQKGEPDGVRSGLSTRRLQHNSAKKVSDGGDQRGRVVFRGVPNNRVFCAEIAVGRFKDVLEAMRRFTRHGRDRTGSGA